MQSQWFIIQTLSGQEQKVKDSIEKRLKAEEMGEFVREVLVPMEKVVEVRNQKKTVTTRKLWPGYVFVDMVLIDADTRRHRLLERSAAADAKRRSRRHQGANLRFGRN
jgi:transcriptional antiterminator NusG